MFDRILYNLSVNQSVRTLFLTIIIYVSTIDINTASDAMQAGTLCTSMCKYSKPYPKRFNYMNIFIK